MPLLSPIQVFLLKTELAKPGYAGKSDQECNDMANAVGRIPNPAPQKIPKPLPEMKVAISNMLSPETRGKLGASGYLSRVLDAIDQNDREKVMEGMAFLTGSIIPVTEAAQLGTLLKQTVDDPKWLEFLPGPSAFQSIQGLGDVPIVHADGHTSVGTCYLTFIQEARA